MGHTRRLVLEAWGLQASSLEVWLARRFWNLLGELWALLED